MSRKEKKKTTPAESHGGRSRKHFLAIALMFVSLCIAYSNSLNGTWAMDDVVANKPVGLPDIQTLLDFRKVAYLTFLLNQAIAPFSPANFRVVNILIHFLNALLVYVLAYRTMLLFTGGPEQQKARKIRGFGDKDKSALAEERMAFSAALLSGVVFALHPININAVAYIVQRMTSLATLFVLLSLLCYIAAFPLRNRVKSGMFYALSGILLLAGIFSKENAVVAIPLILLYDYVFLSNGDRRGFVKRSFVIVGISVMSIGVSSYFLGFHHTLLDIVRIMSNPNQPIPDRGWTAVDVYWTPLQHILTEFRVVSRYLFLICLPLPQFLVFDWWGFPISTGITEPIATLLCVVWLSALLVFSLWAMKRFPLLCFGILWYLTAVSLESFLALGADFYFEHRNYLPVSGLFIGVIGQIVLSFRGKISEKAIWSAAVILSLLLTPLTFLRNTVWKDSVTLWSDTLKKSPSNIRAMMALGNAYLKISDMDDAGHWYEVALTASSRDRRAHYVNDAAYTLGMLYLFKHELGPAKTLIEKFDEKIESYRPKILKGFYKALNNDIDGALRDYREVIGETKGIDSVVVFTLMGDALRKKGLYDDAIEQYQKAIGLDPSFSAAYYGIGASYLGKRNGELAADYFRRTLSVDPDNILALSDMADLMLIRKEKAEEALVYARKAIAKSPPFYQPYLTMGNILTVLGREREADDFYHQAIERGMADYMLPFSKARAYYMKGDLVKAGEFIAELRRYKDLPEGVKRMIQQKKD
ncbi:MAG: tetratricopeptide repeat protein [Thermodesulfovibrionales bacterium]|jgi:tetratricopeptide (TPR) repeat protein